MDHRVALFDAFTAQALGGSVAAMVDDASGLDAALMQKIAREFGAPATCFITDTGPDHADVRFFSTRTEYPMCGHATLGLATWLVEREVWKPGGEGGASFVLTTPAASAAVWVSRRPDDRIEVMLGLAEAPFEASKVGDRELAAALGIAASDFSSTRPIEYTRTEFNHLVVPVSGLEPLERMTPDFGAIESLCLQHRIDTVVVFTTETINPHSTVHCREFAPAVGAPEAPAAGTTNRALACYLIRHGLVGTDGVYSILAEQGYELGRPSEIKTLVELQQDKIVSLQVGGLATKTVDGWLNI